MERQNLRRNEELVRRIEMLYLQTLMQSFGDGISVEYIKTENDASCPFQEREGQTAFIDTSSDLPGGASFFVLPIGEVCRVRMDLETKTGLRLSLPIAQIIEFSLIAPDGERVSQEMQITEDTETGRRVLMALFDPSKFNSRRMRTPSSWFGTLDKKFVELRRILTMRTETNQEVEYFLPSIYLRIVKNSRMWWYRLKDSIKQHWAQLPDRLRRVINYLKQIVGSIVKSILITQVVT